MKLIIFSILISISILLCGCKTEIKTDGDYVFDSETVKSGDTVLDNNIIITEGGVFTLSGNGKNAQISVDTNDSVTLVLDNLTITSDKPIINVVSAKSVTISLPDLSKSSLSAESTGEDEIAIIDSKSDLIFEGNGLLSISSSRDDAIVCEKNISVSGGTYSIDVGHNGIDSEGSITFDGGNFNIKSGNDAIKSENDTPESAKITFNGGSFNISAIDDGASTSGDLVVNNANINITECEEGLEGKTVVIENGNINIVSSDDGINARGIEIAEERYEGAVFTINGGTVSIDANGDGIDSNGDLNLNGGQIFISGAADGGNSAIDFDLKGFVKNSTVIATGYSGMFRGIQSEETNTINVYLEEAVADTISLSDASENILINFAPTKKYNHIFVASPSIKTGSAYTLKYGEAVLEMTVSESNTVIGNGGRFGGGFSGRGPSGPMPDFSLEDMPEVEGEYSGDRYHEWKKPPVGDRPGGEGFPKQPPENAVETYNKSKPEDTQKLIDNSEMIITNTYYKLDDGSFECGGYNYKYRLDISGRLNNATRDSRYIILSNTEDITFDEAWKASGLSSNTNDYFSPDYAVIVERAGL